MSRPGDYLGTCPRCGKKVEGITFEKADGKRAIMFKCCELFLVPESLAQPNGGTR